MTAFFRGVFELDSEVASGGRWEDDTQFNAPFLSLPGRVGHSGPANDPQVPFTDFNDRSSDERVVHNNGLGQSRVLIGVAVLHGVTQ